MAMFVSGSSTSTGSFGKVIAEDKVYFGNRAWIKDSNPAVRFEVGSNYNRFEFGEPDNQTTPYLTVRGGTVSGGGLISGSAISTASFGTVHVAENVGIGTTAGTAYPLAITQGGTESCIYIDNNSDAGNAGLSYNGTGARGPAIYAITDQGSNQGDPFVWLVADNTAFDKEVLHIQNDGTAPAIVTTGAGNTSISGSSSSTGSFGTVQVNGTHIYGSSDRIGIGTAAPTGVLELVTGQDTWAVNIEQTDNDGYGMHIDCQHGTYVGRVLALETTRAANSAYYMMSALADSTLVSWIKGDGSAYFAGDVSLEATKKLYLDGGSNTYLYEYAGDRVQLWAGGQLAFFAQDNNSGIPATSKLFFDGGNTTFGSATYIQQSSEYVLDFVVGSAKTLQVNTTSISGSSTSTGSFGRVGVGTASPSAVLHVEGNGQNLFEVHDSDYANPAFKIIDGGWVQFGNTGATGATTDVLIIDSDNNAARASFQVQGNDGSTECLWVGSSGNVGIGTTSADLPIKIVRKNADSYTQAEVGCYTYSDTGTTFSVLRLGKSNSDTISNAITTDGQYLGAVIYQGNDGSNFVSAAHISAIQDGSRSGTNIPAEILFEVNNGSGMTSPMIIRADGNVGIGTTVPKSLFHVFEDLNDAATATPGAAASYQLYINGPAGTTGDTAGIALSTTDGASTSVTAAITAIDNGAGGQGHLAFSTMNSSEAVVERMRILSNGNVGIGTTSPTSLLEVSQSGTKTALEVTSQVGASQDEPLVVINALDSGFDQEIIRIQNNGSNLGIQHISGSTENFVVNKSGYVGIGTNNPDEMIHVESGSIMVESSAYGQGRLIMKGRTGHQYEWYIDDPHATKLSLYNRGDSSYDLIFDDGDATFGGSISKSGGSFNIRHPDPAKSGSMMINHSFVESPTAGDNIYTYIVSASSDNQTVVTDLPDYWQYLNENPRMWIQPKGMFAQAYGEVSSSLKQMKITMEKSGSYDVLLIGTRKDVVARSHWNKVGGVETLISGSKFEGAVPCDSTLSSSLGL